MKIKTVKRYYCDFCKKANCSAGSIKKHEASCTNNPNRVCRMCAAGDLVQSPLDELIAAANDDIVRHAKTFEDVYDYSSAEPIELRKMANGCPACMLAAARVVNKAETAKCFVEIDFTKEKEVFWAKVNDTKAEYMPH